MGRNFKFQVQDIFWNISFWRFEKRIVLSEKKPPLQLDTKVCQLVVGRHLRNVRDKSYFSFFSGFFLKMGHISPTTLRIEVVEILFFFEVTRNIKRSGPVKENIYFKEKNVYYLLA
jgi:hypothetical protein